MDKPIPKVLFTCLILLVAMFPRILEAKIVDRIVAIVNGEIMKTKPSLRRYAKIFLIPSLI
jgi:hypothetical protein